MLAIFNLLPEVVNLFIFLFLLFLVDIVFVIDCTKGDKTKLDEIKAFIRHSVSGLAIGTRGDHVGVVTYGGKADVKFNLNK